MVNLDQKIFGKITVKEIIGADPPAIPHARNLLENEFQNLINELDSQTKIELKKMLTDQQLTHKYINSKLGAMALAQDKIRLFTEYNLKYIEIINSRIGTY